MDKFKNKYRVQSVRLQNYDYGSNGAYFITICTANRKKYFGEIATNTVETPLMASQHGKLAEQYWNEIPKQFPFVELDAFVVMPNHIHGILIINKNITNLANNDLELQITKNDKGGFAGEKNPMLHENISRIIRWYKGRCSFEIHKYDKEFSWQSNYYEHVIRNEDSFQRISEYIINNPLKWIEDKFYNENLQ